MLTFENDPSCLLGGEKQIYTLEERADALESIGLKNLLFTPFSLDFASKTPMEFLDALTSSYNIKAITVGGDYTFGKGAAGNVALLRDYCAALGIDVIVVPFEMETSGKISTSNLKALVKAGDIEKLNALLSQPYFMIGEIEHARRVGTALGFPTANVCVSCDKLPLADGIYATKILIDGQCFDSMTNVGAKPTFDITARTVETFIFDFHGDLYGKRVKLSFFARTRGTRKFDSAAALKQQLSQDERQIRSILQGENNDK